MSTEAEPFIGSEALATGRFTRRTLYSRNQLIFRNVFLANGVDLTPERRAVAAWLWSGRRGIVAGVSAAALHGSAWINDDEPAELTRTEASANGIVVHRERLQDSEVCDVRGIPTTTIARTAFDLGRRKSLKQAVIRLDALANATGLTRCQVQPLIDAHRGVRGLVQLREALAVMDGGAESPQETSTRLVLMGAGLRRPETQIEVFDDHGHAFARVDMGWEEYRVGVEYDGKQHWEDPARRDHDINRHAKLAELGWVIVRVSASLLRQHRDLILRRTCNALAAADCRWLADCGLDPRRIA